MPGPALVADPAALPDLPIRPALPRIVRTLIGHGSAVLVAPPGTGKTTLVPLALAGAVTGRVIVAEPRRVAARAAAARMAALLAESVGERVGYAVRGDSRSSAATRVEVVTSGLLLRRLMRDPELPGVGAVVLDECHERHLDADLLLTLLLDAREGLRPDLPVLAASATVAADRLAALLDDAPVVEVEGRTHPVGVHHVPPARGERIEACVARTVRRALADGDGSVLAFLPGVAEIRRTAAALAGLDVPVLPLHGRLTPAEQDAALRDGGRRVVLATSVAESSLTVPGVRTVVDAGLSRVPRVDHRRGLAGLVTIAESRAQADQRAGRAGREAPGAAYRCWPEGQQLAAFPEPEIRTADLTRLALDLAAWGTADGAGLRWWDAPPPGPLAAGQEVLRALGAIERTGTGRTDGTGHTRDPGVGPESSSPGTITPRGERMAALGLHPRLARALLDGAAAVGARASAEVVALLDDDSLTTGVDLAAELGRLRSGIHPARGRWRAEATRLAALLASPMNERHSRSLEVSERAARAQVEAALVTGLAHPERMARRRSGEQRVFLMAGGTAVEVDDPGLGAQEWLAVAVADRTPGAAHGRVRLAAAADRALAEEVAAALLTEADEIEWADGDVRARRVRTLGAIILDERPLPDPDPERVQEALVAGLRAEGTGLLRWSRDARALRERLAFLHRTLGGDWPDVGEEALVRSAAGRLAGARRRADLAAVDAGQALKALVGWPLAGRIDELAPERLEVPSGSRIAVDYSGHRPVLPVRVQEAFGWRATPHVAGRPVLLHLLSPAGRPAAVTDDLESFWATGYPQVRAELRGRYPKHHWPEDPRTATPTRRTGRNRPA